LIYEIQSPYHPELVPNQHENEAKQLRPNDWLGHSL